MDNFKGKRYQNNNAENDADEMPDERPAKEVINSKKLFKCRKCPHETNRELHLKLHEAIHNRRGREYPYNCKFCRASFSKNAEKTNHEKKVHQVETESKVQSAKARRTTVKSIGNVKSANSSAARPKSAAGGVQSNGRGSKRILRSSIVDKKRTNRPHQANNNGTEYDDYVEIIELAKKSVRRQYKLNPDESSKELTQNAANKKSVGRPRIQRSVPAEIVPAVANANAAGPSEAISSIMKECAKSNSVLQQH